MSTKKQTQKTETTQVPEGATAATMAVVETAKDSKKLMSPHVLFVLESALTFLAGQNEIYAAILNRGTDQFFQAIAAQASADVDGAQRSVKYVMRQAVNNLHYRYASIQRQQMLAARANGGGVDGYELPVSEIVDQYANYAGGDSNGHGEDNMPLPGEHMQAVEDLHLMLSGTYVQLQKIKFSWLPNYEAQDLPFFWYVDQEDSQYHELDSLEAAFHYLDQKAERRQEQKKAAEKSALDAIANMQF
jgi:hypothetical protein